MDQLRRQLDGFSDRRFAAAVATALTRTAVAVRAEVQALARASFDRPTPYTMRQLRYVGASADNLRAAVGFDISAVTDIRGTVQRYEAGTDTPASKYLQFQTLGGQRGLKRFEKALQAVGVLPQGWLVVPGERAKLDAFGNQAPSEIRQVLSWFDAAELVAGSRQNMREAGRERRRKGTRKSAGWEFFAVAAGAQRGFVRASGAVGRHAMQPGIYRRTSYGMGARIEPVMIFVRGASYKPRFDFYNVAQREAQKRLPVELKRSFEEHAARLLAKGRA